MTTEDLARELDRLTDPSGGTARKLDDFEAVRVNVATLRAAAARLRELSALVDEAAEEIETWGAYAGEYFQAKWDLAGTVERFRRAAQLTETSRD